MKEHHFRIEDAIKHGMEKAVLIYNLRYWIEKNKANKRNIHEHDGKEYYWTFNSGSAFAELFPYMSERSIRRWLQELEDDGIIISGKFNKKNYDQTKWYTLPEYVTRLAKLADGVTENGRPIPDNKHIYKTINSKQVREDILEEIHPFLGFPLPEDWEDLSYYESEGGYVADFRNNFGQLIKKSEITSRKKEYEAKLKNKVSSAKRKETMEEGSPLIDILKEEQGLSRLDGSKNYEASVRLKNAFYDHLLADKGFHPIEAETRLLEQFRGFLRAVKNKSPFHWQNMTSMGYIDRNFNKIIRELK